jgi:hypothetical protein
VADRYAGKPLLRLVECYVLDAIGELGPGDHAKLEDVAPKVGAAVGSEAATWQGVVDDALDLPGDFRQSLRADWESNRERAKEQGHDLTPQEFAEAVADSVAGASA